MHRALLVMALSLLFIGNDAIAQTLTSDVRYRENGHERHVLDIYTPEASTEAKLPIMFWIHGGGWQVGDIPTRAYGKSETNHRQLNNDLGKPDDPATEEFYRFLQPLITSH